jgi:hypothetical protein
VHQRPIGDRCVAVGESIGEAPAEDPMEVQPWRWSRSGRMGGGEIIVARVRV